ncbi:MAG TPA: cation:proton antiporter [Kofleriaceae bacterium]|jgi:CPA2 family monovalent cation:H+ antiporter-2
MDFSTILVELVVVLGTAAAVTIVFGRLKLPVVLGYVLAGLLVGPHVPFPLVANASLIHALSELGVMLLMFSVGLELRLSTLARVGLPAALTALFEVALVIGLGMLVASLLGFTPVEALFAGACLGISSTMLVAKAFEERGWKGGFTDIVFAILVFEDLVAILLLTILTAVASGSGLDASSLFGMLGRLAGFLALLLGVGLLVVPRVMRWVAANFRSETLLVSSLAICFGASAVAHHAGYSVALGGFLAGIMIAESSKGEDVFHLVQPFRDVFAMVFFVSVGMTIDPRALLENAPIILAFAAVVFFAKPLGITLGVFLGGAGFKPAVRAGLSLAQIGELSFVIANIGTSSGVARPSLLAIAVGVCIVTTLTSGVSIARSQKLAESIAHRLPQRVATFISFYEAWLGRLRERPESPWKKLRWPILVLALDAGALVAIVIAAAFVAPLISTYVNLDLFVARIATAGAAAALATPFLVGLVRRIVVISRILALEVIPSRTGDANDVGLAPRRALIITFEIGIGLLVTIPIVAITQPFIPGGWIVAAVMLLALVVIARRSLRDFSGHVRAGSEMLLELLSHPPAQATEELAQVDALLPGFGGIVSITIGASSPAVGKTLATLDLRARTGASVLAIARGGAGMASPSPTEPLAAGDVLAMAGSTEAIAAARMLFDDGATDSASL